MEQKGKTTRCLSSNKVETSAYNMEIISNRQEELDCPPALESAPWLVYPNGKYRKSNIFCSILEPSKTYFKRIPEMRRKGVISSSHGWLVLSSIPIISLFNPVSLETIHLPGLQIPDGDEPYMILACNILFSVPTDPNCLILLSVASTTPLIMYCRPGDKQWTQHSYEPVDNNCILEAVGLSDGTIYARTTRENLVKIERDASGCLLPSMSFDVEGILSQTPPDFIRSINYPLLESCGELFIVWQSYAGWQSGTINHVIVFKMDFSKMAWVKVDDIGGRVFFLGEPYCTSCHADQYSGMKGNCIYYTLTDDPSLYVYDMDDDSISISLRFPDFPRSTMGCPFWVLPMTTYSQLETPTQNNEGRTTTDAEINIKAVKQCPKQDLSPHSDETSDEPQKCLVVTLTEDVQYKISEYLTSMVDYMNFRSVCQTWRMIAPPIRWRSPWLMVLKRRIALFLDPECNSVYRIDLPDHICDSRIHFSKDGWCLMSQGDYSMFFYNPLTKMRIDLPDLPTINQFQGFCFTGQPTSSDLIIFGIAQFVDDEARMCIYFHGEESWDYGDLGKDDGESFSVSHNNPVFVDGNFYCLGSDGYLGVWDVEEGEWRVLPNPKPPCPSENQNFLVETDGELVSVFVSDHIETTTVFKLDRSTMEWVAVESVGSQMLFLSPSMSIATKSRDEKRREMQNKIYFPRAWNTNTNTNTNTDIVFYSLDTGSYNSFRDRALSKSNLSGSRVHWNCTWFQPQFA